MEAFNTMPVHENRTKWFSYWSSAIKYEKDAAMRTGRSVTREPGSSATAQKKKRKLSSILGAGAAAAATAAVVAADSSATTDTPERTRSSAASQFASANAAIDATIADEIQVNRSWQAAQATWQTGQVVLQQQQLAMTPQLVNSITSLSNNLMMAISRQQPVNSHDPQQHRSSPFVVTDQNECMVMAQPNNYYLPSSSSSSSSSSTPRPYYPNNGR
jgi:hypothetical protein